MGHFNALPSCPIGHRVCLVCAQVDQNAIRSHDLRRGSLVRPQDVPTSRAVTDNCYIDWLECEGRCLVKLSLSIIRIVALRRRSQLIASPLFACRHFSSPRQRGDIDSQLLELVLGKKAAG
jgi:hypothetical protein